MLTYMFFNTVKSLCLNMRPLLYMALYSLLANFSNKCHTQMMNGQDETTINKTKLLATLVAQKVKNSPLEFKELLMLPNHKPGKGI